MSLFFTPRDVVRPPQIGIVTIRQLLLMESEDLSTAFLRHVDAIKEPGLHIVAHITRQDVVPQCGGPFIFSYPFIRWLPNGEIEASEGAEQAHSMAQRQCLTECLDIRRSSFCWLL